MHRLYGENPPELITTRVETELKDIIECHYDVIYMSAQKLVQNSLEHGYLVGSRGSVGSSIVTYLSGITEVNSFPPHYRCPNPDCKHTTFDVPEGATYIIFTNGSAQTVDIPYSGGEVKFYPLAETDSQGHYKVCILGSGHDSSTTTKLR